MNAHKILSPARVPSPEKPRVQLRLLQRAPKAAKLRWRKEDLFLTLMVACLGLFAVALALYVVNPAVTTVTGTSTEIAEVLP